MKVERVWQAVSGLLLVGIVTATVLPSQAADSKSDPKHSVVEVMRDGMKKQQWKQLLEEDVAASDKAKLVELFEDLMRSKAPHGDAKSWEKKTTELHAAAEAAVKGETGAAERLKAAVNCASCHREHKQ